MAEGLLWGILWLSAIETWGACTLLPSLLLAGHHLIPAGAVAPRLACDLTEVTPSSKLRFSQLLQPSVGAQGKTLGPGHTGCAVA